MSTHLTLVSNRRSKSVHVASKNTSTGEITCNSISLLTDKSPAGKPDVVSLQWAVLLLHIHSMPSSYVEHVLIYMHSKGARSLQITTERWLFA